MCENDLDAVIVYLRSVGPTYKSTNTLKKKTAVYFISRIAIPSTFTVMKISFSKSLFHDIYIILKDQLSLKNV